MSSCEHDGRCPDAWGFDSSKSNPNRPFSSHFSSLLPSISTKEISWVPRSSRSTTFLQNRPAEHPLRHPASSSRGAAYNSQRLHPRLRDIQQLRQSGFVASCACAKTRTDFTKGTKQNTIKIQSHLTSSNKYWFNDQSSVLRVLMGSQTPNLPCFQVATWPTPAMVRLAKAARRCTKRGGTEPERITRSKDVKGVQGDIHGSWASWDIHKNRPSRRVLLSI